MRRRDRAGQYDARGETRRINIPPGFGRHACSAPHPAITHRHGHQMIHAQRLFPWRHGLAQKHHLIAQSDQRAQQWQGAGGWLSAQATDVLTLRAYR